MMMLSRAEARYLLRLLNEEDKNYPDSALSWMRKEIISKLVKYIEDITVSGDNRV